MQLKELIEVVWNALEQMKFDFLGYNISLAQLIVYSALLFIFARFIFKIVPSA